MASAGISRSTASAAAMCITVGKLSFEELSIEMMSDDHALVRGRFRLQLAKESATGIFTVVMRKLPEGWRIVHDHTSS